jgi:hypothetical protein
MLRDTCHFFRDWVVGTLTTQFVGNVCPKYGSSWGDWCSNEVHGSYGVGLWKILGGSEGVF